MSGYELRINQMIPNSSVALLSFDGQIVARLLISQGVGPKAGRLSASCNCTSTVQPCEHVTALQSFEGFEHIESTKA